MKNDMRRITLLACGRAVPDRDWERLTSSHTRLVMIESMTVLRYTLQHAVSDIDLDIERVILDRAFSPAEYLDLLASLPGEFSADVLLIRGDDSGYLSASGRSGDRTIHSLTAEDVRFYLEANALVTGRVVFQDFHEMRLTA
jgi:hypothetical protein